MAYDGSGNFVRLYDFTNDRDANVKIRADRFDNELDGMATGLSTALTKDGQTTVTADLPMNSKKFTGLAAGSAAGHSVRYEQVRERLAATRNYYVRTDGSNSNTGLANTSGAAFLTLQKAYDVAAQLDAAGQIITINVADGTYSGGVTCNNRPVGSDAATHAIRFVGNTGTPANCVISTTSANCFTVGDDNGGGGWVYITGFKLQTATSGSGIYSNNGGSSVYYEVCTFGACADYCVEGHHNSYIKRGGAITIAGAAKGILAAFSGCMNVAYDGGSNGITITGTPAFSVATVVASGGTVYAAATWTGTATGVRGFADAGGHIVTGSTSASFLPGGTACSVSTGGMIDGFGSSIQGHTNGTNVAAAGDVGEVKTSSIIAASAVTFTTVTSKNVTSLSLTKGNWLVYGKINFIADATTTFTYLIASVSDTADTRDPSNSVDREGYVPGGAGTTPAANVPWTVNVGPAIVNLSADTTYYLVAHAAFATSFMKGGGTFTAVRIA